MARAVVITHERTNDLDVLVEFNGKHIRVKDIGIGHPPHTIVEGRGYVSTAAEIALAEALAQTTGGQS